MTTTTDPSTSRTGRANRDAPRRAAAIAGAAYLVVEIAWLRFFLDTGRVAVAAVLWNGRRTGNDGRRTADR